MPSIANALNDQIRRLSRREINRETQTTRKLTAQHRRDLAELKRQVSALTKAVAFLERQEKRRVAEQPVPVRGTATPLRFRSDGLRSHRDRIGLSAGDYGKLLGVSGQSIHNWETRKARPRREQVAKLAAVRGLGKREVLKRLTMLNGKS